MILNYSLWIIMTTLLAITGLFFSKSETLTLRIKAGRFTGYNFTTVERHNLKWSPLLSYFGQSPFWLSLEQQLNHHLCPET